MVFRDRTTLTVAAVNQRSDISVLYRHLLALHQLVNTREIKLHVTQRFRAQRAHII